MVGSVKKKLHKAIQQLRGTKDHKTKAVHAFDDTFFRLRHLRTLGFNPSSIFDIGASNGRWSRCCRDIFPGASFFLCEPLGENLPALEKFCSEYSNVSCWQGCLGAETGTVVMNIDGAGSSVLPGHYGNPYGVQRDIRVETLDNLLARGICSQPDLIKLDVQGYEIQVFKGARKALENTQAIITEVSFFEFQTGMPLLHEVVGWLAAYGFVVYDILSLKVRPFDGAAGQSDLLFLRESHAVRQSNQWDRHTTY